MSRIQLTPLDPERHPERQVYVGWDPVQRSYFGQVFDGRDAAGEDIIVLDIGDDLGQITDPQQVIDAVASYAQIPENLAVDLVTEPRPSMLAGQRSASGAEVDADGASAAAGTREQAMRSAFTAVHGLRAAMAEADSDAEILRLEQQVDEIATPWQSGPDAADWQWLNDVAEDWRTSARAMRRITDNTRHDLQFGQAAFTPFQYRSLDQAGKLIDPGYRDQFAWRTEHLDMATEQGRLDAQLHYNTATPELAAEVAAGKDKALNAVWGDHTDTWSPERREWELTYSMEDANRAGERDAYFQAYSAERNRLIHPQPDTSAEVTADAERGGARIGRLLAAATPTTDPASAPPIQPDQETTTTVVLSHHTPQPGAGHELG